MAIPTLMSALVAKDKPIELKPQPRVEDKVGFSPQKNRDRSEVFWKLIALHAANGTSTAELAEMLDIPLALLNDAVEEAENFSRLVMECSVRMNQPLDERIKVAAKLGLGRLMQVLADPNASSKEIVSAAKEMLDRHLGKSVQKVQFDGSISVDGNFDQLKKDIAASDKRLETLLAERQKLLDVQSAAKDQIIDAQVISINPA